MPKLNSAETALVLIALDQQFPQNTVARALLDKIRENGLAWPSPKQEAASAKNGKLGGRPRVYCVDCRDITAGTDDPDKLRCVRCYTKTNARSGKPTTPKPAVNNNKCKRCGGQMDKAGHCDCLYYC